MPLGAADNPQIERLVLWHCRTVATWRATRASYRSALMKIYFGFTVAGNRSSIDAARKIVTMLQKKGHEVLTEHLVHDDAWLKIGSYRHSRSTSAI
jgi:hypothetical protein